MSNLHLIPCPGLGIPQQSLHDNIKASLSTASQLLPIGYIQVIGVRSARVPKNGGVGIQSTFADTVMAIANNAQNTLVGCILRQVGPRLRLKLLCLGQSLHRPPRKMRSSDRASHSISHPTLIITNDILLRLMTKIEAPHPMRRHYLQMHVLINEFLENICSQTGSDTAEQ